MAIRFAGDFGSGSGGGAGLARPARAQGFSRFTRCRRGRSSACSTTTAMSCAGRCCGAATSMSATRLRLRAPVRLIVCARDGHVVQRFAERRRACAITGSKPPRRRASARDAARRRPRRSYRDRTPQRQLALGDRSTRRRGSTAATAVFAPRSQIPRRAGRQAQASRAEERTRASPRRRRRRTRRRPRTEAAPDAPTTADADDRRGPVAAGSRRRAVRLAGADEGRPAGRQARHAARPAASPEPAPKKAEPPPSRLRQQPEAGSAAQEAQRPPCRHARLIGRTRRDSKVGGRAL